MSDEDMVTIEISRAAAEAEAKLNYDHDCRWQQFSEACRKALASSDPIKAAIHSLPAERANMLGYVELAEAAMKQADACIEYGGATALPRITSLLLRVMISGQRIAKRVTDRGETANATD